MRHYCTYFDSNYLVQGELLIASLRRHAGPFVLHVLGLDEAVRAHLRARHPDTVRVIAPADLEDFEPRLARARAGRSRVEYYFTCSPLLPLFVLERTPGAADVTYLDADTLLFAAPDPAFAELGDASVGIVEHRFSPGLEYKLRFGRFNVGWISLRNDARAREVLQWWAGRCLDWCRDVPENGLFADQKYLDRWPELFEGVRVLAHPGLNAAPWNAAGAPPQAGPDGVRVGGEPLLLYHFHGFRRLAPGLYRSGLAGYGAGLRGALRAGVYAPYARAFEGLAANLPGAAPGARRGPGGRGPRAWLRGLADDWCLLLLGPLAVPLRLGPLAAPLRALRGAWRRLRGG